MITVTTNIDEPVQRRFELLKLAEELGNVSRACKILGYSRDSYYRFKGLFETGGQTALRGVSRRKPILKNRVQPEIEQAVVDLAFEQPAFGQIRVCNELRGRNQKVSPGGVRSIWLRHGLETFEKRMRSREASLAREKSEAAIGVVEQRICRGGEPRGGPGGVIAEQSRFESTDSGRTGCGVSVVRLP